MYDAESEPPSEAGGASYCQMSLRETRQPSARSIRSSARRVACAQVGVPAGAADQGDGPVEVHVAVADLPLRHPVLLLVEAPATAVAVSASWTWAGVSRAVGLLERRPPHRRCAGRPSTCRRRWRSRPAGRGR